MKIENMFFTEKPVAQWATTKIKKLYKGYGIFCEEIERLLGEPQESSHSAIDRLENENLESVDKAFECRWQPGDSEEEKYHKFLASISEFYKAGFILTSQEGSCSVKSFFGDDSFSSSGSLLAEPFERFTPEIKSDADLKPSLLKVGPLINRLGPKSLSWENEMALHFWLNPNTGISLVVITDRQSNSKEHLRQILYKTQALIQRQFYD